MRRGRDSEKRFPHPEGQLKGSQTFLVSANALGKENLLWTMLLPNFYVASVGSKRCVSVQVTRMSLSHSGGWNGKNLHFHLRFTAAPRRPFRNAARRLSMWFGEAVLRVLRNLRAA